MGMGTMVKDLQYPDVLNMLVPCDYVVNTILVSTAELVLREPQLKVYHVCPTGSFPKTTQQSVFEEAFDYLKYQPWENAINPPNHYRVCPTRREYNRWTKLDLMWQAAKVKVAGLPLVGSKKKKAEEMKRLKMQTFFALVINSATLSYFRWYVQSRQTEKLIAL